MRGIPGCIWGIIPGWGGRKPCWTWEEPCGVKGGMAWLTCCGDRL